MIGALGLGKETVILVLFLSTAFSATLPEEPEIQGLESIDFPVIYNDKCLSDEAPVGCVGGTPMQKCIYPDVAPTEDAQPLPTCPLTEEEINAEEEEEESEVVSSGGERLKREKRGIGKKLKKAWRKVTKGLKKVNISVYCKKNNCTGCVARGNVMWCPK